MRTLVCLVEEPSAKEMLSAVLLKMLPCDFDVRFITFAGKQDLEKQLCIKLRSWQIPNSIFLIMRDQDAGDCRVVKSRLLKICGEAGSKNIIIRIACRELESFYLGDLRAVEEGLGISGLSKKQNGSKFRNPDYLSNPSKELETLTDRQYQKISGSRAIAQHLSLDNSNCSHSFNIMIEGIKKLLKL